MTKNILIAEDDEDIVGLLRLYLEKDGYKVISVDNGEDAFKIVKNSELMRLQLFFDEIPDKEIRTILKHNGFKWSAKNKAWL